MKKYKKKHQKILHYYLTKKRLSQEEFLTLTSLTDEEAERWLSRSKAEVRRIVLLLGFVAEYQRSRINKETVAFLKARQTLGQELYLWSDTVGFRYIPATLTSLLLGLIILSQHDKRLAVIWAIRLRLDVPKNIIVIDHIFRLHGLVLRVLNSSSEKAKATKI